MEKPSPLKIARLLYSLCDK